MRKFATEVLREQGYRCTPRPTASTALRLLESGIRRSSMLFTDVVLPGGMNGRQLADEARRRRPELKVLYATGYTRNAIIHQGRLDAEVELLTKPFTADALARKVRQILDAHQPSVASGLKRPSTILASSVRSRAKFHPSRQLSDATRHIRNQSARAGFAAGAERKTLMSAVAVRAMFRSHPEKPAHSEAMSRCIDACFSCVETCTACADACLSERDVSHLVACIRLNLDCAAVCNATGNIMARSNKAGHRQLLEAQLANCIAFCRACAAECGQPRRDAPALRASAPRPARPAPRPARCMLSTMRMPA